MAEMVETIGLIHLCPFQEIRLMQYIHMWGVLVHRVIQNKTQAKLCVFVAFSVFHNYKQEKGNYNEYAR